MRLRVLNAFTKSLLSSLVQWDRRAYTHVGALAAHNTSGICVTSPLSWTQGGNGECSQKGDDGSYCILSRPCSDYACA